MSQRYWRLSEDGLQVLDECGNVVVDGGTEEDLALCSAAPDLLKACEAIRVAMIHSNPRKQMQALVAAWELAEPAIKKAKGDGNV